MHRARTARHRCALAAFSTLEEIIEIAATPGFWAFHNRIHVNLQVPIEAHVLAEAGWGDVTVP